MLDVNRLKRLGWENRVGIEEGIRRMYNWAIQIATHKDATNEKIGEITRAVSEGINSLQLGFNELLHFKRVEEKPKKENPAL